MATTATNGRNGRMRTAADVLGWIESIDKPAVTTGDVMSHFGFSRATARDRLLALADEGLLRRVGNGGGAKYEKPNGSAPASSPKPVVAASEISFLGKLSADCDRELARIDSEVVALEEARAELLAQEEKLRAERKSVERARTVLS